MRRQMEYRKTHEGGLYAPDHIEGANSVIRNRKLLPNEAMLDIAGRSRELI